jgi:hypothetical protein
MAALSMRTILKTDPHSRVRDKLFPDRALAKARFLSRLSMLLSMTAAELRARFPPSRSLERYRRKNSLKRSAQRSNFR